MCDRAQRQQHKETTFISSTKNVSTRLRANETCLCLTSALKGPLSFFVISISSDIKSGLKVSFIVSSRCLCLIRIQLWTDHNQLFNILLCFTVIKLQFSWVKPTLVLSGWCPKACPSPDRAEWWESVGWSDTRETNRMSPTLRGKLHNSHLK